MLWYTYLYENILFTNKRDAAFIIERKAALGGCVEEDRVGLIKSLITQDRKVAREACYLSETRIGQKCELILPSAFEDRVVHDASLTKTSSSLGINS